jgi:hypothetical protein
LPQGEFKFRILKFPSFVFPTRKAMKTLTLRHSFEAKDQPEIHATMLDFRLFGEVHPLMVAVTLIGESQPGIKTYDVREETKVGEWLKMKPRYTVHVSEPILQQRIDYKARVMGIMQLEIAITYTNPDEDGRFELLETVRVSQIPLLTGIFLKVFRQAHTQAFAHLRQQLTAKKSELQNTSI